MIRPGSAVANRRLPTKQATVSAPEDPNHPTIDKYIEHDDFSGAIAYLKFNKHIPNQAMWLAYCYFHSGQYSEALRIYENQIDTENPDIITTYKACCLYALCDYKKCEEELVKISENTRALSSLRTRLAVHVYYKLGDPVRMRPSQSRLSDTVEDKLCIAAVHFLEEKFDDAIATYRSILDVSPQCEAVHAYLAMCEYRQEAYDAALESIQRYLSFHPQSLTATNLKACCVFQLYDGPTARAELKRLANLATSSSLCNDHDLLRHNACVFTEGEGALTVFPPLCDHLTESRANLVCCLLRSGAEEEALRVARQMHAKQARDIAVKSAALAQFGVKRNRPELVKEAKTLLSTLSSGQKFADTLLGRQCAALFFLLERNFQDAVNYLQSIRPYLASDERYNWNLGIALAHSGDYAAAAKVFSLITDDNATSWICRCLIRSGDAAVAWDMFDKLDSPEQGLTILPIIANECYSLGHYYYAMKAFDALERMDHSPQFWYGKRGAACGVFREAVLTRDGGHLSEVIKLLSLSPGPEAGKIVAQIQKWAIENRVDVN